MSRVQLADVATIHAGGRLGLTGSDFVARGVRAFGAGGVNGFVRVVEYSRAGIILSSIGARCGKCFIAEGEWSTLANTQVILPDLDKVDPRFLWYQLNDETRWHRSGTGQPFIKPSDVKAHTIWLPPFEEQRRIAAILDQADALRAKRRQTLALLDSLTQAIFYEMFGDPIENLRLYPLLSLSDWIDPKRPITYGILKPGPDVPDGVPYVRVADMKRRGIAIDGLRRTTRDIAQAYARSTLRPGDLLMSIRGHVGRFAQVPHSLEGANITQDSARLAVDGSESATRYVRAAMEAPGLQAWMSRRIKGAAVQGINLGDLRLAPIPRPPAFQMELFSARSDSLHQTRDDLVEQAARADELQSSLQSRAFSGRL